GVASLPFEDGVEAPGLGLERRRPGLVLGLALGEGQARGGEGGELLLARQEPAPIEEAGLVLLGHLLARYAGQGAVGPRQLAAGPGVVLGQLAGARQG